MTTTHPDLPVAPGAAREAAIDPFALPVRAPLRGRPRLAAYMGRTARRWPRAIVLAVVLLAVLSDAAHADGVGHILAQRGFGDRQNGYAWAMAWFKGKLYVGTGRNVRCVEQTTTDFYFPVAGAYKTSPLPNVRCPKNPHDLNLRAEIWQYAPRTGRWRRVFRSPRDIPNPRAPGKFLARDIAFRGMGVARDGHGRPALFVSGVTSDEYVPEIARKRPPRLLRTRDGIHFHNVGAPGVIRRAGRFASHRPIGFRGIQVWKGRLFVTASAGLLGAGAIFRVDHPFRRRARFRQVSPPDMQVFEFKTFAGALYVGAGDPDTGYSVWKISRARGPYRFEPVVLYGAGRGKTMTSVLSMESFRGHLYVGAVGWAALVSGEEKFPTAELIRIGRDDKWSLVVGNPRFETGGNSILYPLSGLNDGFENVFNAHFWRMVRAGGALYMGTLDWSYLVQRNKTWSGIYSGVLSSLLAGELGYDVWGTCNGIDWFPVTRNAFDGDMYDFGARTMVPDRRGGFIVGTANHGHGTTLLHDGTPACSSLIDRRRRLRTAAATGDPPTEKPKNHRRPKDPPGHPSDPPAAPGESSPPAPTDQPAPPQGVLTDAQSGGTVVSWEPSPDASRYLVMRADLQPVQMSFVVPPALPSGFRFDDDVPIPAAPGTAGSFQATLPIMGQFAPVGMTRASFFVDRAPQGAGRHAYLVVAESSAGTRSTASNMQIVPDPRPPATFAQLERTLTTARTAAAGGLAGRWRRGDRSETLAELARMRRRAVGDDARELAYRLERRLRYAGVAGGR